MKKYVTLLLLLCLSQKTTAQIVYESPLGFNLSFDNTWKRLPKEILRLKMTNVKNLLDYQNDIQFDACFQKIGNTDMDYPYILIKNIYSSTNNEDEIRKVQEYFTNKPEFDKVIQKTVNNKFDFEVKVGENYYDAQSRILIFTYDMGMSIKGNLVGMFAFYFGKNASLITYCYSYKDEFKYDQKEFLNIIYSIKDKGMTTDISDYIDKHNAATKFYNDGIVQSNIGNTQEAVRLYNKAIESYPIEDTQMKSETYYNRGLNKRYLEDYKGAIADYTQAIKLKPDYYKAYNNRGYAKLLLKDYVGAITDFTMTIKYDNFNTEFSNMALGNRGIAKLSLGQDGCPDIKKAIELGNKNISKVYNEYCR